MFVTLVRLIGVVQITFPKYCMSNSALITDNKAHFNACLLPKKNWYSTFPFSMERSSGPIMCISSVDWSFCKTYSEENTEMDVKRPLLWPCQHMILQSLQTWAPRTQSTAVCLTEAAFVWWDNWVASSAQGQVDLLWRGEVALLCLRWTFWVGCVQTGSGATGWWTGGSSGAHE